MTNSPIGLVGIGLLGTALAERMLAAGFSLLGYDLARGQLERLAQLGGTPADNVDRLPAICNTIVLCLPHSGVVRAVVEGWGNSLTSGAILIDATTGDPDETTALSQHLARRGVTYIDATIAGSSEQVRSGLAVIMMGGDKAAIEKTQAILTAWSPRRFHVGSAGSGARFKLIVNLVLGLNRAVLAEGLALARMCGIDPAAALEVLIATPAFSSIMNTKGPKMVARDYTPQARLAQHLKDVGLIRQLAARNGAHTPLTNLHEELLRQAIELGYGEADNSAIIEAFLETRNPHP